MTEKNPSKSLDVLGVKPIAEATLVVTKGLVDGAGAILGRICLPAAEEFGLLLRDKVSAWRNKNIQSIAFEADTILNKKSNGNMLQAHPKIVGKIIEHGSWEDDENVQKMWAGLLASSCNKDGSNQDNLIFINLLDQITSTQALLLDYICKNCDKNVSRHGLLMSQKLSINQDQVFEILGTHEIQKADIELDHLREIGLLSQEGGFFFNSNNVDVTPSALALYFYVRCQGHNGSALDFFGLSIPEEVNIDQKTDF